MPPVQSLEVFIFEHCMTSSPPSSIPTPSQTQEHIFSYCHIHIRVSINTAIECCLFVDAFRADCLGLDNHWGSSLKTNSPSLRGHELPVALYSFLKPVFYIRLDSHICIRCILIVTPSSSLLFLLLSVQTLPAVPLFF